MLLFLAGFFTALCNFVHPGLSQDSQEYGLNFGFPDAAHPQHFNISVDAAFIEDSLARVEGYRPYADVWNVWTNEGPPSVNISHLVAYWKDDYDWFDIQAQMNANLSHCATTVPGSRNYSYPIPLHYVHEPSSDANAIPLLLLHGWPSSHLEWESVIGPLSSDFHVVAPDLPGFGFSPAPLHPGLGPREVGDALDALMHQLGYDRYGIITTDLGWVAGMWMVGDVAKSILGHFTTFYLVFPTEDDLARFANQSSTPEEISYILAGVAWTSGHSAYQTIHIQKPQALSLAFADSPVGFAGWIWDLVTTISDGWQYTFEDLITRTMLLWIQSPYGGIRTYLEFWKPESVLFPISSIPTGVSQWGNINGPDADASNLTFAPRKWIERTATNLVFLSRHDSGGHFPSVNAPEVWLEDVGSFFSQINEN